MCNFAKKLTETPSKVNENDIQTLRDLNLTDKDISQIVQIIGYFNYINRVADGLGLEPEDFIDKKSKYIFDDSDSNSNSTYESFLIISVDVKAFDLINIFHSKYVDVSVFYDSPILSILKLIENELRNKPIGYKKVISLMSDRLIYEIMRSLIASQPLFSGVEENYKFFSDQKILSLLSFLQKNLDKELSNKVISNHLNISEDYVGQFFKNSIGFSPQDYIEHKRMERAIELLREDENAVKVISNEVGYKDTAYFCRRFKLMFGVQAGKMRKRLGEI